MNLDELKVLRTDLETDIRDYILNRVMAFGDDTKLVPANLNVGYHTEANENGTTDIKVVVVTEFKL